MARRRTSCKHCKEAHVRCDGSDPNCHKHGIKDARINDVGRRLPFFSFRKPSTTSTNHNDGIDESENIENTSVSPQTAAATDPLAQPSRAEAGPWTGFEQANSMTNTPMTRAAFYTPNHVLGCSQCGYDYDDETRHRSRRTSPRHLFGNRHLIENKHVRTGARASAPAALREEEMDQNGFVGNWPRPSEIGHVTPPVGFPSFSPMLSPSSVHSFNTSAPGNMVSFHHGSTHKPPWHQHECSAPFPEEGVARPSMALGDTPATTHYQRPGAAADHGADSMVQGERDSSGLATWLGLSLPIGRSSRRSHGMVKRRARASAPDCVELYRAAHRSPVNAMYWAADTPGQASDGGPMGALPQAMEGMSLHGCEANYDLDRPEYGVSGAQPHAMLLGPKNAGPKFSGHSTTGDHVVMNNDQRIFRPFQGQPVTESYQYSGPAKENRSRPYSIGRPLGPPRSPGRSAYALQAHSLTGHGTQAEAFATPHLEFEYVRTDPQRDVVTSHAVSPPPARSWPRFGEFKGEEGLARRFQPTAPTIIETSCDDRHFHDGMEPGAMELRTPWSLNDKECEAAALEGSGDVPKRSAYSTVFGWLSLGSRAGS